MLCTLWFILPAASLKMRSFKKLGQQSVCLRTFVATLGVQQHQQARTDLSDHLACHFHACQGHPLQ